MIQQSLLKSGDCLLYHPAKGSFFGWVISLKTWHFLSHCECYIGDGFSVASRDGIGVNIYPVRLTELQIVLRPKPEYHFKLAQALKWFLLEAKGQKYDWLGLLRFGWRSEVSGLAENNRMFCSEFLTRFYRAGSMDPFNGEDADAVPPYLFEVSPVFEKVKI